MRNTLLLSLLLCSTIAMTGCGGNTSSSQNDVSSANSNSSTPESNIMNDIASGVSQFLEADGREYGKTYTAKIGEKLSNEFFSMKVNEAYKMTSVSGYTPDNEGFEFLCVNVTSTNISDETINVGAYDFTVRWGDGEEDFDYALEGEDDFGYELYTYGRDLPKHGTETGNVYFIVPSDATELKFEYIEIYDDEFNGNTYQVELSSLEYKDDPYKFEEPDGNWGNIGDTLSTRYFDMTVNDIIYSDSLLDFTVDEGYKFLSINVTLTHTSIKPIKTGGYYFYTYWGNGDEDYMEQDLGIEDFPYTTTLERGNSITGDMFYVVPDTAEKIIFEFVETIDGEDVFYSIDLGGVTTSV